MPYRIRLREPVEGHYKFWGRAYSNRPWQWSPGAHAHHYPDRESARQAAQELVPKYGPIDVVTIDGKEVDMWEDAREFDRRVDAAVAKAKAEFQQARKKTTLSPGDPEYYRIHIDALDVDIMPFDVIDALKVSFSHGCAIKYLLRAGRKGLALDDLRKARNCIDREIARVAAQPVNPITPATTAYLAGMSSR